MDVRRVRLSVRDEECRNCRSRCACEERAARRCTDNSQRLVSVLLDPAMCYELVTENTYLLDDAERWKKKVGFDGDDHTHTNLETASTAHSLLRCLAVSLRVTPMLGLKTARRFEASNHSLSQSIADRSARLLP